jgi:hypothetical protein
MFPEAPAPTVPITFVEDPDLDALLIEFPNHLIIPTVMEHFWPFTGGDPLDLGYIAKEMAGRLSVHNNAVNGLEFDDADRINNLVTWIKKLKKSANSARRKRQLQGKRVDLVPFEGQCIDTGQGDKDGADTTEEADNGGTPTPFGLLLKQRADETIAEYAQMMAAKAKSATGVSRGGETSASTKRA